MARTAKVRLAIYDDGIFLGDADSIDFAGSGVSGSYNSATGRVTETISGSTGTSLTEEIPSGVIDNSNVTFTVAHQPLFINVNGGVYAVGDGAYASYVAGTITLNYPVGTGGFITSYYQ